jgi:hypothetical protein
VDRAVIETELRGTSGQDDVAAFLFASASLEAEYRHYHGAGQRRRLGRLLGTGSLIRWCRPATHYTLRSRHLVAVKEARTRAAR